MVTAALPGLAPKVQVGVHVPREGVALGAEDIAGEAEGAEVLLDGAFAHGRVSSWGLGRVDNGACQFE